MLKNVVIDLTDLQAIRPKFAYHSLDTKRATFIHFFLATTNYSTYIFSNKHKLNKRIVDYFVN